MKRKTYLSILAILTVLVLLLSFSSTVLATIGDIWASITRAPEQETPAETIRILSIGNSYSVDQQRYVHQMAQAAGVDILVGNAYIGGCTFRKHLEKYETNAKSYTYYENSESIKTNATLSEIISKHDWDYVTFQCGTESKSTIINDNPYLNSLANIIHEAQPQADLVYNLSWPDGTNSTRDYFKVSFDSSQDKHFAHLVKCATSAYNDLDMPYVTPGGVAYRIAYTQFGNDLHRDGYHMSDLGRYLMACVWFEFFTGLEAPEDYKPENTSHPAMLQKYADLRAAAHQAIEDYKSHGGKTPSLLAKDEVTWSVDGLQIVGNVKTQYKVGEYFDYTSFTVQSTKEGSEPETVTDYTLSITDPLTTEDTSVSVCYDGLSIEIPIQVTE